MRLMKIPFEKKPTGSLFKGRFNGVVVKLDTQWKDLGSWSTLWDFNIKDNNGNVTKGDVIIQNARPKHLQA
jgi:mannose-1-phosphate guanylyltransferase